MHVASFTASIAGATGLIDENIAESISRSTESIGNAAEDKSEIEDTDDTAYLQYHNMKEQKEIDFKIKIFAESRQYKKEKKKLKEKNKCDLVISIPLE